MGEGTALATYLSVSQLRVERLKVNNGSWKGVKSFKILRSWHPGSDQRGLSSSGSGKLKRRWTQVSSLHPLNLRFAAPTGSTSFKPTLTKYS